MSECVYATIMVYDDGALWSHAHDQRFTVFFSFLSSLSIYISLSFFFVSNFRFSFYEHSQRARTLIHRLFFILCRNVMQHEPLAWTGDCLRWPRLSRLLH